ncbi:MAG: SpoIIE family protein phosphatase, partial [Bacteroidota bacterium]
AGHLFVACIFFTLLSFLSTSGAIVIASCWLVLCPMFAFLYISKSAGYTWAAITVTAVATLQIAQLLQYEFPVLLDGRWVARLEIGASVGIIIVVVAVVVTYEAERDKLLGQLRNSHKDISEQNQEITQQNEEIRQQQEEIMTINENLEGEKKKLVEAHDLIQATNKNVTDSIRYASTIQQAVLPDQNYMKKVFDDLFILYKPKDIVSGDFYWVTQVDNKKVIAVCDCTGHGVPGAFMSMIGAMLLTEIVSKQQVTDPAQILELLDSSVRKRLNQREGNNKDGMDVCLCVIEKQGEEVKVEFTGAKRDLYYYSEQKLGLLKGDRRTIGGFMISEENFTKV